MAFANVIESLPLMHCVEALAVKDPQRKLPLVKQNVLKANHSNKIVGFLSGQNGLLAPQPVEVGQSSACVQSLSTLMLVVLIATNPSPKRAQVADLLHVLSQSVVSMHLGKHGLVAQ
jgi:hypothetical protein